MSEVIKLHQDEGVINLLHALPASRRRPSSSYVTNVSPNNSSNHRRRPSNEVERGQAAKGLSQAFDNGTKKSSLNAVLQRRHLNPENLLRNVIDPQSVRPCTQDELMKSASLDMLKQLPAKDYARLWSSPARYNLVSDHRPALSSNEDNAEATEACSQASPNGSVTSIESSVSKCQSSAAISAASAEAAKLRTGRTKPWRIQTKHFKDILLRTYGTFAQVILSSTSTGLKGSINANVCEELIDILKQLDGDSECRAIMLTGIGGTFCQGVDLTLLANDSSADKQRRAAESLANSIKRLVKQILSTSKVLVAAVNGKASGLGVTILPYFDLVYASDKAEFSMEYGRLGQIPEAFLSTSKPGFGHEILLTGQCLTAKMAQDAGIVSGVMWPSTFLEEIVPRLESLEFMNDKGLLRLKHYMKRTLKDQVNKIMDTETQELISIWSSVEFAKNAKKYLKSSFISYQ